MRIPIPQLTALLLFVHISFGCCLHHAHTCDVNGSDAPSTTTESCPCNDHQHDNDDQSSEQDKSPPNHSCSGDKCVFNKTETSSDLLGLFTQQLVTLDLAPGFKSSRIVSTMLAMIVESNQPPGYPPLRTYLFNQILLI